LNYIVFITWAKNLPDVYPSTDDEITENEYIDILSQPYIDLCKLSENTTTGYITSIEYSYVCLSYANAKLNFYKNSLNENDKNKLSIDLTETIIESINNDIDTSLYRASMISDDECIIYVPSIYRIYTYIAIRFKLIKSIIKTNKSTRKILKLTKNNKHK
jgi:hypothetical protein